MTLYKKTIGLLSITAMFFTSCNNAPVAEEAHEEESRIELSEAQYKQANITLNPAKMREMGSVMLVNGSIELPPLSNVSISMPYGGFLKYTEMLPGTQVKKGQLLAIIENPEFINFQKEYLERKANSTYLEAEYIRQKTLYEENVGTGKIFEMAKSQYLSNEGSLKALEAQLKLIGIKPENVLNGNISSSVNIYAPVSGAVRDVYTNIGSYVNPQDKIMDLTNRNDLHVELTVYESDIEHLEKGQEIRFSTANMDQFDYEAKIFLIGSGIRKDRSLTVHGHLIKHYPNLLPGMYVKAAIESETSPMLSVKTDAIVRFNGKHYVFTYAGTDTENGEKIYTYNMLEVEKGISENEFTAISFIDTIKDALALKMVESGAFTLLAKAKNTGGGGHHH